MLLAAVLGAVAVAITGQVIIDNDRVPSLLSGLGRLSFLFPAYGRSAPPVAAGMALLVVGSLAFGLSTKLLRRQVETPSLYEGEFRFRTEKIQLVLFAGGLGLWSLFIYLLAADRYSHPVNLLLLTGVAFFSAAWLIRDKGDGQTLRLEWPKNTNYVEAVFLIVLMATFIGLNAHDLDDWKYSAIGDEYNNFNYAVAIARGAPFNPWSHRGADDLGAVIGSAGQALFLKFGSETNFHWKLYGVVIASLALVPAYLLFKELFNFYIAAVGTVIFAGSHYMFGYAHHGGFYLDALLPLTLALWLLVHGLKKRSSTSLFFAGLALGLGFYTYEAGRSAVVIAGLFMLFFGIRAFRPGVFLPLSSGFIMMVVPLFATDGVARVIEQMTTQSAIAYSSEIVGNRWDRVVSNAQLSFVSFNYSTAGRHYVWGSLADPVTAVLGLLGLGMAISRATSPGYRLLVLWWLVPIITLGWTHPYPAVPVSRLQIVVPALSALSAVAFYQILITVNAGIVFAGMRRVGRIRSIAFVLAGLCLVTMVWYLNIHRFWYEMPRKFGTPTDETAVVRAYRENCQAKVVVIVARDPLALLQKVFASYKTQPMPIFVPYAEAVSTLPTWPNVDCVIVQPGANSSEEEDLTMSAIPRRFPDFQQTTVTDLSGQRRATLFAPIGESN